MTRTKLHFSTGCLAIVGSGLVIASQATLAVVFDYPNVMRETTLVVLQRYHAAGVAAPLAWFAFALGAFAIAPLAVLLQSVAAREPSPLLRVGTTLGVLAGFSYTIGIMRWVLLAKMLATEVVSAAATSVEKASAAFVFRAFDVYCGNSFGETVAPLTHGAWATILGVHALGTDLLPKWMAWAQIVCGIAIAMRPLEYVGYESLGEIGDIGVGAWTVLLAIIGIRLLRQSLRHGPS
ncbi:MAG TPA: DUF4386 family protein [Polyangiaceae bacterium]|nr:DUF4386 family protein [Polyangiaceae bacterium]